MPLFESKAIVLKAYNLAEADRIVVFLTEDHGVVRGVAKGVKRLNSRFGSCLEAFSVVKLEYFQKDAVELVSIRHAELERSYFEAAADPAFLQKFSYLADILLAMTPPHDPNDTVYRMVAACLESASQDPTALDALGVYFELWALRLDGYLPNWEKCDECGEELAIVADASVRMNFHLLCPRCVKARAEWTITGPQRDLFYAAQQLPPAKFAELASGRGADINNLSQVLKRIISHAIGREVIEERSLAVSP